MTRRDTIRQFWFLHFKGETAALDIHEDEFELRTPEINTTAVPAPKENWTRLALTRHSIITLHGNDSAPTQSEIALNNRLYRLSSLLQSRENRLCTKQSRQDSEN